MSSYASFLFLLSLLFSFILLSFLHFPFFIVNVSVLCSLYFVFYFYLVSTVVSYVCFKIFCLFALHYFCALCIYLCVYLSYVCFSSLFFCIDGLKPMPASEEWPDGGRRLLTQARPPRAIQVFQLFQTFSQKCLKAINSWAGFDKFFLFKKVICIIRIAVNIFMLIELRYTITFDFSRYIVSLVPSFLQVIFYFVKLVSKW